MERLSIITKPEHLQGDVLEKRTRRAAAVDPITTGKHPVVNVHGRIGGNERDLDTFPVASGDGHGGDGSGQRSGGGRSVMQGNIGVNLIRQGCGGICGRRDQ